MTTAPTACASPSQTPFSRTKSLRTWSNHRLKKPRTIWTPCRSIAALSARRELACRPESQPAASRRQVPISVIRQGFSTQRGPASSALERSRRPPARRRYLLDLDQADRTARARAGRRRAHRLAFGPAHCQQGTGLHLEHLDRRRQQHGSEARAERQAAGRFPPPAPSAPDDELAALHGGRLRLRPRRWPALDARAGGQIRAPISQPGGSLLGASLDLALARQMPLVASQFETRGTRPAAPELTRPECRDPALPLPGFRDRAGRSSLAA